MHNLLGVSYYSFYLLIYKYFLLNFLTFILKLKLILEFEYSQLYVGDNLTIQKLIACEIS